MSFLAHNGQLPGLTQHVPLFVLPALKVGNITLYAEMEHGQVFDWVLLRIQSSNETEPSPFVEIPPQLV